jgi:hypothetical protein
VNFDDDPRMHPVAVRGRRLARLLMLIPSCLLLGCGATSLSASPSQQPANPATIVPSPTPTSTPVPTPRGGPAPPQLAGSWLSTTVVGGVAEDMTLSGTDYRIGEAFGNIAVSGNQIYFFNGPCSGVGGYRWEIHGGLLHFTLMGDDPCGRRPDLDNRDYKRIGG